MIGKTGNYARMAAIALFAILFLAAGHATPQNRAETERMFEKWLETELWPQARSSGISRATFGAAFRNVTLNWDLPDLIPPGSAKKTPKLQRQAEFGPPGNYFSQKNLAGLAASGRLLSQKHAETLGAIVQKYGVPAHILLAVWGRESGFGRVRIPHDAFQVLSTKAFMSARKEMFEKELIAALMIVEKRHAGVRAMKSSWAGALGQPQFLPTSFLNHAVDFDGDGVSDIWNSVPDTLASIAAYLRHYGWITGRDWGFEVEVPAEVDCFLEGPDRGRTIADWEALGVKRVSGKSFPSHEVDKEGFLLMPAGRFGPAFIVTPNFYVLKQYNESDLYALFVGHAGDRIAYGVDPFTNPWRQIATMFRSDIAAMQNSFEESGYDVGGADGLPGFKTRRSIGEWQKARGFFPNCFPDPALLAEFK